MEWPKTKGTVVRTSTVGSNWLKTNLETYGFIQSAFLICRVKSQWIQKNGLMYILHLYYVHLQFKFSSRFFFYETGTSISIFILPLLCKLFQYISELEFVMVTIKNGTNEQNDPNCIISFNLHDNTGNKALLALLFLLYGWRP